MDKEENQTTAQQDNKQKEVDLGLIPAIYNSLKGRVTNLLDWLFVTSTINNLIE